MKRSGQEFSHLRKLPVFEDLEPDDLAAIHRITAERRYDRNQPIFEDGRPGEGFHYIRSGKVKIVKVSADGKEHILNILGPGEVFAEVLLFNDAPYPAGAVAVEDSVVGVIRNRELEALLVAYPKIAVHIIRVMSKKLQYIQSRVKLLALADSQAKIAQALDHLVDRYGRRTQRGWEVALEINRQDLANMAGTTRETVSRVFRTLKDEGVIEDEERRLVVLDRERLRAYFEES